jgi:hypothetical protein
MNISFLFISVEWHSQDSGFFSTDHSERNNACILFDALITLHKQICLVINAFCTTRQI